MSDDPGSIDETRLTDITQQDSQSGTEVSQRYVHITCTVERTMNSHGALRLSAASGRRTFQVVEYATNDIRRALTRAVGGTTVRVRLIPLNSRGNAWRVTAVLGNQQPDSPRVPATD